MRAQGWLLFFFFLFDSTAAFGPTLNANRQQRHVDPRHSVVTTMLPKQHAAVSSLTRYTRLMLFTQSVDGSCPDSVSVQRTTAAGRLLGRFLDTTADTAMTTKRRATNERKQSTGILVSSTLGIVGKNTGLMVLSILLVKGVYAIFFPRDKSVEQPAGILNRCPWPFVIFHDPKQFLKDSPTWMVVTWILLGRILKASRSVPVVG